MQEGLSALVLGPSGAVGKEMVRELIRCPRFKNINLITRRKLEDALYINDKIKQSIVDFDDLGNFKDLFQNTDAAFCCLGTTKGKSGAEGFIKVDKDYVFESAKILKEANCPHFSLVSSKGANSNSSFLYLKTKGEVENMISELDFPRYSIFRPSLLICDREESRPLEKISQMFARGFDFRSKFSISVETVAHAMLINCQLDSESKVEYFEHPDVNKLGTD